MTDGADRVLVLGASGLVGRGLMHCGMPGAVWAGRTALAAPGYRRVDGYGRDELMPLLEQCDVLVHLAALTRDQRSDPLRRANVDLPLDVARWLWTANPKARFVFMSSDMAAFAGSPYGRSKRAAEEGLAALNGDAVCLRASLLAVPPVSGRATTMGTLVRSVRGRFVPVPGSGGFTASPLWVGDLAAVVSALAGRRGRREDNGVWRCEGEAMTYRELVLRCAGEQGARPRMVPVPPALIRLAGEVLCRLNPTTAFPVDFARSLSGIPRDDPSDIFAHLDIERTPLSRYIAQL